MSIQHDPVVAVPLAVALWLGAVAAAAVAVRLWITASAADTEAPGVPPQRVAAQIYQLGKQVGRREAS